MQDFYNLKFTPYNLQNKQSLKVPKTITSKYDTQVLCFRNNLLQNMVPIQDINNKNLKKE